MTIPEHVLAQIRAEARAGSRAAHWTRCRRCAAVVLRGLDADRCALTAHTDPEPIDEIGELAAILTGRATYDRWQTNDRIELNRRNQSNIAGERRVDVVVEHVCGQRIPGIPSRKKPMPSRERTADVPF